MSQRLFHGGRPGLIVGDLIRPGHSRDNRHPGCPICAARAEGGPSPIDPASQRQDRVYVTLDKEYARYYASLYGNGDLYRVVPVGELEPSPEDEFHSFTCEAARVIAVYARSVVLTMGERRTGARAQGSRLLQRYRRWAALEGVGARDADHEFLRMVGLAR